MIKTKLTAKLSLSCPIISAPMAYAGGGLLAAAVSRFGGLGLIGGGYGDRVWIDQQFQLAGNEPVGCGLITWSLRPQPELLDQVIARKAKAIFLSFGNPTESAKTIKDAGIPLICQVQTIKDAQCAIYVGSDVIVAQGGEAGGHGQTRSTMTLVPEIADLIAQQSSDCLLCAAGGIGDGRGLAAALMLGADGVVIGSRLWASTEALVHPNMQAAAISASGDDTLQSKTIDLVRQRDWPERYAIRVIKNDFTDQWHDDQPGLKANLKSEAARWDKALVDGDVTTANAFVGEVTGIIRDIRSAEQILSDIVREAEALLGKDWG